MSNITLTIIKPEAVTAKNSGGIISMIEEAGFKILAIKKIRATQEIMKKFYEIHKERPFYQELVDYMCDGEIIPILLQKENAVEDFRTLVGATDPKEAVEGTIRAKYGESKPKNAVHGSDSDENASLEWKYFFSEGEILD
jgi:nucleoside-diphosphate kinase